MLMLQVISDGKIYVLVREIKHLIELGVSPVLNKQFPHYVGDLTLVMFLLVLKNDRLSDPGTCFTSIDTINLGWN